MGTTTDMGDPSSQRTAPGFPKAVSTFDDGLTIQTVCNTPDDLKSFEDKHPGCTIHACSLSNIVRSSLF